MHQISKIQKAIKFATKTHEVYQKQKRKGKNITDNNIPTFLRM
jgi:hypothetical protein